MARVGRADRADRADPRESNSYSVAHRSPAGSASEAAGFVNRPGMTAPRPHPAKLMKTEPQKIQGLRNSGPGAMRTLAPGPGSFAAPSRSTPERTRDRTSPMILVPPHAGCGARARLGPAPLGIPEIPGRGLCSSTVFAAFGGFPVGPGGLRYGSHGSVPGRAQKNLSRVAPLAARMRPRTLDEFVGQQHFLGPGKLLRRMLEADRLTSVIFYGPPGPGRRRSPSSSPTTPRAISSR